MSAPKHFTARDGIVWRRVGRGWHSILPKTAESLLGELQGREADELRAAMSSAQQRNERSAA